MKTQRVICDRQDPDEPDSIIQKLNKDRGKETFILKIQIFMFD